MICLRCGHCCKHYAVVVVKDPDHPPSEDNVQFVSGLEDPCPHLEGDKPGDYSCAVHDKDWYEDTPCAQHGQVEQGNTECRIGRYLLDRAKGTRLD